jgi:SAM-dependent methyltransferase
LLSQTQKTHETQAAQTILDRLLDSEQLIDRFDASYLDDLPEILRELHGVTDENAAESPDVRELWRLTGRPEDELRLADLAPALEELGVDPQRYSPKQAPARVTRKHGYGRVGSWRRAVGLRLGRGGADGKDAVNAVQAEYSIQSGGDQEVAFTDLARPETGDPWTQLMIDLRERGAVGPLEPVLTIGPRWTGEIDYFRERIGLKGTIGLDLFSPDEELIKVGDMHEMPFEDDTFGLVYQRNTFDKSYDIRAALRECVRVLRDGGVLITDDCYAYTDGVSELSRTSIKHNDQILRVLGDHVGEVLHDRETESDETWIARVGQLAVRIRK